MSYLTMAGQRDKSITGQGTHLIAHTAQGDQPGNFPWLHLPRSHSLSPCRLTSTKSCCKTAQQHPGSEVTSSVEAHKVLRATNQPQTAGTGCSASSLHPSSFWASSRGPTQQEGLRLRGRKQVLEKLKSVSLQGVSQYIWPKKWYMQRIQYTGRIRELTPRRARVLKPYNCFPKGCLAREDWETGH